ncbi:hypothetical protein A2480_00150 [Candidatus Uhrbacteria bacterium RIFOXYC2_FULL_47_19]|uniref:Uncharacterized protein n=1 Tax=Candidatus Uhrbacteria bacterium RIFOXYC2_FULL_47_19 TaxID=1802424 RepID=A0A1F7WEA9_9BACT|nr:MAG: hypothetical protein A2480_00150 [Candidatus Uhrbacteria bacterium RIFOXYC2_FULL_47_19]
MGNVLATIAVITVIALVFLLVAGITWWWCQNAPLRRYRLSHSKEEEDDNEEAEEAWYSDVTVDAPNESPASSSLEDGMSLPTTGDGIEIVVSLPSRPLVGPGQSSSVIGGGSPVVRSVKGGVRSVGPQMKTKMDGWPALSEDRARWIVAGTEELHEADQSDIDSVPTEVDKKQSLPGVETSEIVSVPELVSPPVAASPVSAVPSDGQPSRRHQIVQSGGTKMFVSGQPSPVVPGSVRRRTGSTSTLLGGFGTEPVKVVVKPMSGPKIGGLNEVGPARPPTESRPPRRHRQARTVLDAGPPASMSDQSEVVSNGKHGDSSGGSSESD